MNWDSLLPSVIAGASALVAGLLGAFKEEITAILWRGSRRVDFHWKGEGQDVQFASLSEYEFPESYLIEGTLKQWGRRVTGEMTARGTPLSGGDSKTTYRFEVKGTLKGDFLRLEYSFIDRNSIGGGVMLLELLGSGAELKGVFLGLRQRDHGIAAGSIVLTKD